MSSKPSTQSSVANAPAANGRPAQATQQALALVEMQESMLPQVLRIETENMAFPWTAGNFRDSLKAGHQALVMQLDEQIVGFAVLMMVLDEAHLLNIGVDKRYQGQGLGKFLLQSMMQLAQRLGGQHFFLEVRTSNHIAIRLYESLGIHEMGVRPGYYPAKQGREDAILMGCALCA
jgi:ribosomal-protein-alanine N-acetyltransferase